MTFPRSCWYVAAECSEVGRQLIARTILGEPIVLFRTEAGTPVALQDRCPHRFMPLSKGQIVGDSIRCVYHGAQFDRSGSCVAVPGIAGAPARLRVRSYPVVERYGWIWIWTGETALADDRSIPANAFYGDNDHPVWKSRWNCFQSLPVGFQLIGDNLLDITHAQHVHPESFGFPVAELARNMRKGDGPEPNSVTYKVDAQRRHIALWLAVTGPLTPYFHEALGRRNRGADAGGDLDFVMHVEWAAPCCFSFHLRFWPADGAEQDGMGLTFLHLLTPETESRTHYFFKACHDTGDDALTDWVNEGAKFIFGQDKDILEAQQRALGNGDLWQFGTRPVIMRGDELAAQARRIIETLEATGSIAGERRAPEAK